MKLDSIPLCNNSQTVAFFFLRQNILLADCSNMDFAIISHAYCNQRLVVNPCFIVKPSLVCLTIDFSLNISNAVFETLNNEFFSQIYENQLGSQAFSTVWNFELIFLAFIWFVYIHVKLGHIINILCKFHNSDSDCPLQVFSQYCFSIITLKWFGILTSNLIPLLRILHSCSASMLHA